MTIQVEANANKGYLHQYTIYFSGAPIGVEHVLHVLSASEIPTLNEYNESFEQSFPNNGDSYVIVSHVVFRS